MSQLPDPSTYRHLLLQDLAEQEPKRPEGLSLGYVPGVMPGKWLKRWEERYGQVNPLLALALVEGAGLEALDHFADLVLLRVDEEEAARDKGRYHLIELYREQMVLVLPKEHLLTLLEQVSLEDLSEEFLIQGPQKLPNWEVVSASFSKESSSRLPAQTQTTDALDLVAAGLGLMVLPLSLARFYHRKDLTYRPLLGVEESPVALVWKRELRPEEQEEAIQDFVGITRGRTAQSQRGRDSKEVSQEKKAQAKQKEQAKRQAANRRRESEDRKRRQARKSGNLAQHLRQTKAAQKKGSQKKKGR